MKDLVFELWILLAYLETMFVNINYLAIELMIDVVNINYLAIELINVVNIVFNSSDVVVNIVVKWMCSEFETYTGFVVNSNIFLNLYRAICVGWLKPADTNTYLNLHRVVQ
jgi:hypothetical protein